jgi:hypothetical protein
MSRENVQIMRRAYEHFNATGEIDLSVIDPDVELDFSNAVFDAAVYHGRDGLREWLSLVRDMWKRQWFEPQEFIRVGEDQVIVSMRVVSVGRGEIETVAHSANLFTLQEGMVTHLKAYQGKADALEAVGLSE